MTVFSKWGLALVCVLIPIWLISHFTSVDSSPTLDKAALVKPVPNEIAEQQLANGLRLWRDKKYQQAAQTFSELSAQELTPELQTLTDLYQYHATAFNKNSHADFTQHLSPLPESCNQRLLFVTPKLESLPQAEYFRSRFAQDPRLKSLSICIYAQTWFDPQDITCEENWQQSGRLGCQILSVAEKLKKLPFTHLVMFADKGKANVHNGIMFLDRQDTYDVFVHELAHFSGFIDEYPLSKDLAKRVCAGVDAPNMVFSAAGPNEIDKSYWQSIELNVESAVFKARTCDNHSAQAFKASSRLTFMEYHDVAYIPKQYLAAWQKRLNAYQDLPPAHVNFAQLYEQQNNQIETEFWRNRYQEYLAE
jgi:hypothetical protein